jgi:hypothetical protein
LKTQFEIGKQLFKKVSTHIAENVEDLDPNALQASLISAAQSEFGLGSFSDDTLRRMERKVLDDYAKFMNLDFASIIQSFTMLGYRPSILMVEMDQLQALTFNKYSSINLLESLLKIRYDELTSIYDKLFASLHKNSPNINQKLCARVLKILKRYKI